jgi:chromosome segregation ATPase
MDEELRAYLDQRFSSIDQQFSSIDQGFSSIDQRFDETRREIQALREETTHRFDRVDGRLGRVESEIETLKTQVRGAYILTENVQHKIEVVAEGVAGVSERLDRFITQQTSTNKKLEHRILKLEAAR